MPKSLMCGDPVCLSDAFFCPIHWCHVLYAAWETVNGLLLSQAFNRAPGRQCSGY